ncbi:MAG TPA: hypothetical protein VE641_03030 [Chthoniobacterales bacterium]|nr:hypothetical protein [Chthoniobacterales bacterium]
MSDAKWQGIADVKLANVFGIKNAPPGFLEWAMNHGAVSIESDAQWVAMQEQENHSIGSESLVETQKQRSL